MGGAGRFARLAVAERPPIYPLQLELDAGEEKASVLGVTALTGREFDLIAALAEYYRDDLTAGRRLADFQYARTDQLAGDLSSDVTVDDQYVRQLVRRVRKNVSGALAALEEPSSTDVLIQTGPRGRGYRLNPEIRLVSPDEV